MLDRNHTELPVDFDKILNLEEIKFLVNKKTMKFSVRNNSILQLLNTGWVIKCLFYLQISSQIIQHFTCKSVMIHRQVHLPIPCYDFCFL